MKGAFELSASKRKNPWKLYQISILIAVLGAGFGTCGVPMTLLLGIIFSPFLLRPSGQKPSRLFWFVCCHPMFLLLSVYLEWLIAWSLLGHLPRPRLDKPIYIPLPRGIMLVAVLLLMASPVTWVAGFLLLINNFVEPSLHQDGPSVFPLRLVLIPLYYGGVFGVMHWDPFRVFEWFMN